MKINKKITYFLVVILACLLPVDGCKKKNPQSRKISKFRAGGVTLENWQGYQYREYCDSFFLGDKEGKKIYHEGFAYSYQVKDRLGKDIKQSGFLIRVSIEGSNNNPYAPQSVDLWNQPTSHDGDGTKFGFLKGGSFGNVAGYSVVDEEKNLIVLEMYSDGNGKIEFVSGWGDPGSTDPGHQVDPRYRWPGEHATDDPIVSYVHIKIEVPGQPYWWPEDRKIPPKYCHMALSRVGGQPFWKWYAFGQWNPGVFNTSYQELGQFQERQNNNIEMMASTNKETSAEIPDFLYTTSAGKAVKTKRPDKVGFGADGLLDQPLIGTPVLGNNRPISIASTTDGGQDSTDLMELVWADIMQFKWGLADPNDPNSGTFGYWFMDPNNPLTEFCLYNPMRDPNDPDSIIFNDPNLIRDQLGRATPYAYVVEVEFLYPFNWENQGPFLMHLCAYDQPEINLNSVPNRVPLWMHIYSIRPDNKGLILISDLWDICPEREMQSEYWDQYIDTSGFARTLFFIDEECVTGLEWPDPWSDFNADRTVDITDMAWLCYAWMLKPGDPGWQPMFFNDMVSTDDINPEHPEGIPPVNLIQLSKLSHEWGWIYDPNNIPQYNGE